MESCGGKADHLIRLKNAGFSVPAFFVIREGSQKTDVKELFAHFVQPGETYAVRSSASVEDTADTSMAGLFETFLNIPASELPEKVEACFASAQSKRVHDFLKARGIEDQVHMSVIVQQMVPADLSGVLFTSNPQGIMNEMTVILGAGPGNLVVEDKIPVTTLIHHFHDEVDLVVREEGTPLMDEELSKRLTELALQLKTEFGTPMDAEFSIEKGKLWLLQARPITTLQAPFETILDNSNISESYPGITQPLSIDFAKTAYAGVFNGLVAGILNEKTAEAMGTVLHEMVTASSGRMYYQINNWYKIMKLLPLSAFYIPVWQEMMGVVHKEVETQDLVLSPLTRVLGIGRFLRALRKTPARMKRLDAEFQDFRQYFETVLAQDPDKERLVALFEEMKAVLLNKWDVTLLNDVQAFIYTAALKKLAAHKENRTAPRKKKGSPADSASRDVADLNFVITQIGELESLKPIRLLARIARIAPGEFLALETEGQVRDYVKREGSFPDILRAFIKEYGDRYLEELKLESRTFRTDPQLLQKAIQELRDAQIRTDGKAQGQKRPADAAVDPDRSPVYSNSRIYKKAVEGIRNREISRLNRTRIFGMARELFLRLGDILESEGNLDVPRDVFWLELSEVLQNRPADYKAAVAQRKLIYREYQKLPVFTRLVFNGRPFDRILPGASGELRVHHSGEPVLIGTGASPGIVRGEVLLVEATEDARDTCGKILVTRQTDPGWVFLIANSAGLITERGSLLSHTAIISRELGKPAVVGLKNAVQLLCSGEIVEMNGSTGQIRRIESHESH